MPTERRRQIHVQTAPEIKAALVEYPFREGLSLRDAAVHLLADRVGFTFTRSGRRLRAHPSSTSKVVLLIPASAIRRSTGWRTKPDSTGTSTSTESWLRRSI